MSSFLKFVALGAFALLNTATSTNAADQKQGIEIIDHSHDPVGAQFVFAIKERFLASQTFKLMGPIGNRSQMIVTTTKYESENSNRAIYSIIWLSTPLDPKFPYPSYISDTLGYCDKASLDDTAKSIVAMTSKVIDAYTDGLTKSLLKEYGK